MKKILIVSVLLLTACTAPQYHPTQILSSDVFNVLPNWYDDRLGLQLLGNNIYPDAPHKVLLQKADIAFMEQDMLASQTYLERAQRIETRDAGVYVRLSYLYWLQQKPAQALQTARRALSVVGADELAKEEIHRLIHAINQSL